MDSQVDFMSLFPDHNEGDKRLITFTASHFSLQYSQELWTVDVSTKVERRAYFKGALSGSTVAIELIH